MAVTESSPGRSPASHPGPRASACPRSSARRRVTTRSAAPWAETLAHRRQHGAHQHGHADEHQCRCHLGHGLVVQERALDHRGQRHGLDHDGDRAQRGQHQRRRRPPGAGPARGRPARDPPGEAPLWGAGGRCSHPKCRVLQLDGPADQALGERGTGGGGIFAGGSGADPIGQVGHDDRALGVEPVRSAEGDGGGGHDAAGRTRSAAPRRPARVSVAASASAARSATSPPSAGRRGGPHGQAGLGEHARHRGDQAELARYLAQPVAPW